jgi:hypothetical protein
MTAIPTKPGIYHGMDFDTYRKIDAWNWSLIKLLDEDRGSPLHVKHKRETADDDDTASRMFLRAIHALTLEPHRFDEDFSIYDGRRDMRHKSYQDHLAKYPGTTVLTPKDRDHAQAIADAIRSHPFAGALLKAGRAEVTVVWQDIATGLLCKARIDWLAQGNALIDLKGIGTAERQVTRLSAQHGYHGQLAHYDSGLQHHGIEPPMVALITYETKPPYDVAVFEMDRGVPDGSLHVGEVMRSEFMEQLADCVRLDHWPGRHLSMKPLTLPSWALLDHSDEITFEED